MTNNTEIATIGSFNVPVFPGNFQSAVEEEMEGLEYSFNRVKIPAGGGLTFEVPGDNPDSPDSVKELIGVIVDHHPVNAFWSDKYSGQNNPPDCSSMDGKKGIGKPGGACSSCPYNDFGSAEDGKGKACKNMRRIYLLPEGDLFPLLITLPPTSIKSFSDYIAKRIITKGLRSYSVVTKITLKRVQNSNGISYSQAQFSLLNKLPDEIVQQLAAYSADLKKMTRKIEIVDEYDEFSSNEGDIPF